MGHLESSVICGRTTPPCLRQEFGPEWWLSMSRAGARWTSQAGPWFSPCGQTMDRGQIVRAEAAPWRAGEWGLGSPPLDHIRTQTPLHHASTQSHCRLQSRFWPSQFQQHVLTTPPAVLVFVRICLRPASGPPGLFVSSASNQGRPPSRDLSSLLPTTHPVVDSTLSWPIASRSLVLGGPWDLPGQDCCQHATLKLLRQPLVARLSPSLCVFKM